MTRLLVIFGIIIIGLFSCADDSDELEALQLERVLVGDVVLNLASNENTQIPIDRPISVHFSAAIDPTKVEGGVLLLADDDPHSLSFSLVSDNKTLILYPAGTLETNTSYLLRLTDQLRSANGARFATQELRFETVSGQLRLTSVEFEESGRTKTGRIVDVPLSFSLRLEFSTPVDSASLLNALLVEAAERVPLTLTFDADKAVAYVKNTQPLQDFRNYTFRITTELKGLDNEPFSGYETPFFTALSDTPKFPMLSEEELLTEIQRRTFRYFYDFAHQPSGMIRERNTSGNLVTTGGSGFGVMALLVGISRNFITRIEGVERIEQMVNFLSSADRFHGVWPHWMNGQSGGVIPFSVNDDGADLVETALLMQGLLTARAFLDDNNPQEVALQAKITRLWEEVEWDWFTRNGGERLYWLWSPTKAWVMNLPISGYNEALITYLLAASSPTHGIGRDVYESGWARDGAITNGRSFYGIRLPLGEDLGGPLFFSHYSFLALDPRKLKDKYADYWIQCTHHVRINRAYCIDNPKGFAGYGANVWGLTASDNQLGYSAHSPTNDMGVIAPTAAIASIPFTPEESMEAINTFYYQLGDRLWGEFGFYDAFNPSAGWYADSYLAIDQGPILLMIENHRSGLLWDLLQQDADVQAGMEKLGFTY
nr:hypothetical protein [Cytophagales bacterium]